MKLALTLAIALATVGCVRAPVEPSSDGSPGIAPHDPPHWQNFTVRLEMAPSGPGGAIAVLGLMERTNCAVLLTGNATFVSVEGKLTWEPASPVTKSLQLALEGGSKTKNVTHGESPLHVSNLNLTVLAENRASQVHFVATPHPLPLVDVYPPQEARLSVSVLRAPGAQILPTPYGCGGEP